MMVGCFKDTDTRDIHRNHSHVLEAWRNFLGPLHSHSTISPCFLTNGGISSILLMGKSYRSRFILIFWKQSFPPAVFAALLGYVISQQALKCFSSIRKSSVIHRIRGWNTGWSLSYSPPQPKTKNARKKTHNAWSSACTALSAAILGQCHSPKATSQPQIRWANLAAQTLLYMILNIIFTL